MSDTVFSVQGLRDGSQADIYLTYLKLYSGSSLNTNAIISHVVSFVAGTPFYKRVKLVSTTSSEMIQVRSKRILHSEDTLEPLAGVYEVVSDMLCQLPVWKNTDS